VASTGCPVVAWDYKDRNEVKHQAHVFSLPT
jgi:hypothetical protein